MVSAIVKEILLTQAFFSSGENMKETISTLYFGGGTPSILTTNELTQIFSAIHKRFVFANDIEITLEVNPDDVSEQKLMDWQKLGINRLSVGIQSFKQEELIWMNRAHTSTESLKCIDLIQQAGFVNFSIDLIYGSPLLNDDEWKRNIEIVLEKNIPHISCYALTVEPKTALSKMITLHKSKPVSPEKQSKQFLLLMHWMNQHSFEHYEISNFAIPGFRSRHNSSYWRKEPYYGFGPAAHSFDGTHRRWNIANNSLYIQALQNNNIPFEEETLTQIQQLNEDIMISLRTMEGLDLDMVAKKYGEEKRTKIIAESGKYLASKKIRLENNNIILTNKGKLFADGIAADLFF